MLFRVDGINFAYDERTVLKDVSVSVASGCFYGILGPNGSGKSTLIDLLMGCRKPRSGTIFYKEKALHRYPRRKLAGEIALVPQNFYVNFPFTAQEVVIMGRYPHMPRFAAPSAEDLEIVSTIMKRTGTEKFKSRYMTEMSGGERQRVIFARALVQETPVLMLDEATSNLDISHTLALMGIVAEDVRRKNKTVIAVIQDINLAASFCDRLILMQNGGIVAEGPTEEILNEENLKNVFRVSARTYREPYSGELRISFQKPSTNRTD